MRFPCRINSSSPKSRQLASNSFVSASLQHAAKQLGRLAFALLTIFAGLACAQAPAVDRPKSQPKFDPPPRLATTAAELQVVKSAADFAAVREAAVKAAQPLLGDAVILPEGFGSWIFYYSCPDDGGYLTKITPTEHECPTCKKRYTDERTVAAYRCRLHYDLEAAAEQLAWAYAYTGEDQYATAVRRILLHLADAYDKYPARQDRWGRTGLFAPLGGRRYVQSLDEGVGAIRLAKAYDLTRMSPVWSATDQKHVEEDFFRLTAKTLLAFNQDINNHQTWYDGGLMAIASVLGDAELVEKVLTMRGGYYDQLNRSLGEDGLWYEGTMAYQNYALQAMLSIVDVGRRLGLPLHQEPKFRKLLESSLDVTYPNGQYPAINDSDPSSFQNFNLSYQWAWDVYKEPRFAQALAYGNPERLKQLLGPDAVPVSPLNTKSIDLPDAGMAILRVGEAEKQSCVFFDYGQHGGGHGHYDKLNITLFAAGREWLFDTGRIDYTHKEYKTWVKHTVAHNTVVLGERSQSPTTGKLLWLKVGDGYAACAGETDDAYPGATLKRQLFLTEKMLIEVYDVQARKPTTIDWLTHTSVGPVQPVEKLAAATSATFAARDGYPHLKDPQLWPVKGASQWDFIAGMDATSPRLRAWLPAVEGEKVLTAVGIGSYVTQAAPCLIRRREANQTRFVTVFDLTGTGTFITDVKVPAGDQPHVQVQTTAGAWDVVFGEDGPQIKH